MSEQVVHVVPHTHWDREWYSPFQRYRARLVRLLDKLLEILKNDPDYRVFTLDGQTIPLLDYLEIKPERRAELEHLVRERRLLAGPWHILPDEFLVSGESHIRNLMLGHRISTEFGFTPKFGYCPDTFGHISQLPQIFRGFGIDNAILVRGISGLRLKAELWWDAPDGSRVLMHHLPEFAGYSSAAPLPRDPDRAAGFLIALARQLSGRVTTSQLLAMQGIDHAEARADLPRIIERANELAREGGGNLKFVHSSMLEYVEAVGAEVKAEALEVATGELRATARAGGGGQPVLPNILSSRIYNKIQNVEAQTALERWAEPWAAFASLHGDEYPKGFLWKAWEWLIQNHPHDSIGGCSVDEVHAQMETRFAWAKEIAENVADERFRLLASRMDLSWLRDDEFAVVVFNGLAWDLNETITADLDVPVEFLAKLALGRLNAAGALDGTAPAPDTSGSPDASSPGTSNSSSTTPNFRKLWEWEMRRQFRGDPPAMPDTGFKSLWLRTKDGPDFPGRIEEISTLAVGLNLYDGPSAKQYVTRIRATFKTPGLPGFGWRVLAARVEKKPARFLDLPRLPANTMENENLRVEIRPNGSMDLTHKATGRKFEGLGYFEDGGDNGDGYNFSPPPNDEVFNTHAGHPRISCIDDGPVIQRHAIEYDLRLPAALTQDRKARSRETTASPLRVILSLAPGSTRLDFEVHYDNRAKDHRLRAVFPTDIATDLSHSDAPFDVVAHPVNPPQPSPAEWIEDEPVTFPMQSFVDLSDGKVGLCLIAHGLPEYEVVNSPRREIALTLLRAVGFLGAGQDPQTIIAGAGPKMPTPGGQCLREFVFRFSLCPHAGTWADSEVWRQAHAHEVRPQALVALKDPHLKFDVSEAMAQVRLDGDRGSFLRVEGKNAVLSAVKRAENGDGLVLRLYNPSDKTVDAVVTLDFDAGGVEWVDLNEGRMNAPAPLPGARRIALNLPRKRIATIKLPRASRASPGAEV